MFSEGEASIARIYSGSRDVIGAGFLVSPKGVLTCAHVIIAASEAKQEIYLDFPAVSSNLLKAKVVFWKPPVKVPTTQIEFEEDIALLEILDPLPIGIQPIKLIESSRSTDFLNHPFRTMGFPKGKNRGAWAYGKLGRHTTNWVQIEVDRTTGYQILHGFSGAPVFDETLNGVVGMIVAAEIEQKGAKVAFMLPAYILNKANPGLEKETLAKVLDQVINIHEIHAAIANNKSTLIQEIKTELRSEINQMDTGDVFTLCLMRNQEEVAETFSILSGEYVSVLSAFIKKNTYKGKTVQTVMIAYTLKILQKVILDFYTSWSVKKSIEDALSRISFQKIKTAVEDVRPYQGNSDEIAQKIYQLLKRYEIVGSNGGIVDDAFRSSVLTILGECGIYSAVYAVVSALVIALVTNIFHASVGGVIPFLLPGAIAILMWQAFTFRENIADKVSHDVSNKVSSEFNSFNIEISRNVKSQIIKNVCEMSIKGW